MSHKTIGDNEFEAVIALPAPARYKHVVKQVADWQQMWSLRGNDGWVLGDDDQGHEAIPVWPHARYAAACATGNWEGSTPVAIKLATWIDTWLPGIERDGRLIAVFPTPATRGVVVTPQKLRDDLDDELQNYE